MVNKGDYHSQIDPGDGLNKASFILDGAGKISVNVSGPRGGGQRVARVEAADLLEAVRHVLEAHHARETVNAL